MGRVKRINKDSRADTDRDSLGPPHRIYKEQTTHGSSSDSSHRPTVTLTTVGKFASTSRPPMGGRHVETALGTTGKAKSVTPPPRTADAAVSGATTPAAAGRLDVIDAVAGRPLPWRRSIGCPTRLEI